MLKKGVAQTLHLHLHSGITALLRSTLCGSVDVPEETARTPLGVSLSELVTSLILIITMEPNSPKKIQFAVPLFQSQIAPEAAEQIRKRRPTPASLVILNEHNPPGKEA
ncbi:uncharacterized protein LOC103272990 [Carlito syrichta]|uniref:Uncharacterized protein LOC103272990 n=2 Tax=Boreoeutheria TaxID=1437010 RepID=A0A1U7US16_CARSF|nr:uncharacterized protein LOC103272990 [Carlito syrichta]